MRIVVTGQVGMEKKAYLEAAAKLAGERGETIDLYHVGDRMYAEAPDVKPGRILDLPISRLHSLRRSAMKDIISESANQPNIIVNSHATFRWRHGLFPAFDFDQLRLLKPDILVCLVDNIEVVHHRLHNEHTLDATLKDLMVWREEEIMATELAAQALGPQTLFCIVARGRENETLEGMVRLTCREGMKRVYPSFPMTHVVGLPEVQKEIDGFREELAKHFITFDPGDVDEKLLLDNAVEAAKAGQDFIDAVIYKNGHRETFPVPVRQILDIAGDIDGQIYMRDFKLIDQSDMIVSLVPELPGGMPGLSSGVERELQHAFEHGKEVYVVWKPAKNPSPFITETATKVFRSTTEALKHFEAEGMFVQHNLFGV
ncbi:AAA family ATPase [Mucisphaera sp.]|uniref:AAA family ATPase n=1 Tax=Mucisphaera sp. TaxID=2913024 RepID=UPI003D0FA51E